MASYPLVTLPSNNFFPGSFIAVNLGAGANVGGGPVVNAILLGNALSTSQCVTNALYDGYVFGDTQQLQVSSVTDAFNQFGARSDLYLGILEIVKTNPNLPTDFLAVKESTGSAASATVTISGPATVAGSVRVFVGDAFVDVGYSIGDSATTLATNVQSALSNQYTMPATVVASSNTLTFTAVHKGIRGNDIRFAVKVNGNVSTGITTTNGVFANLSGGTGTDSYANALVTLSNRKYRYIISNAEDCTGSGNMGTLVAQVTTQALPKPGMLQRVVGCVTGTVGTANAAAKSLNNPRAGLVWQENGNKTRMQLAAQAAAGLALGEAQTYPMVNYDFLGGTVQNTTFFKCSLPFDGSTAPQADLDSALSNGVMPVMNGTGSATLVSAITTYTQDASGNPDSRVRDWCVVSIMDYAATQIKTLGSSLIAGASIAPDPPNGQALPNANVITPGQVRKAINYLLFQLAQAGLVPQSQLAGMQSLTDVIVDSINPSRMDAVVNIVPILPCHQLAVNLNQISSIQ